MMVPATSVFAVCRQCLNTRTIPVRAGFSNALMPRTCDRPRQPNEPPCPVDPPCPA